MTSCTATNLAGCPWHWLVVWRPRLLVACVIYFCGHWVFATRVQKNTLPRCIFENRTAGSAFQDSPPVDFFTQTLRLHSAWHTFCECFWNAAGFTAQTCGVYIAGGVAKQLTWCTWRRPVIMKKVAELCRESEKRSAPEMLLGHPEKHSVAYLTYLKWDKDIGFWQFFHVFPRNACDDWHFMTIFVDRVDPTLVAAKSSWRSLLKWIAWTPRRGMSWGVERVKNPWNIHHFG